MLSVPFEDSGELPTLKHIPTIPAKQLKMNLSAAADQVADVFLELYNQIDKLNRVGMPNIKEVEFNLNVEDELVEAVGELNEKAEEFQWESMRLADYYANGIACMDYLAIVF